MTSNATVRITSRVTVGRSHPGLSCAEYGGTVTLGGIVDLRSEIADRIDARRDGLIALSHAVHADAEIAYEEHASSRRVAAALEAGGFDVLAGVCDLPTAFLATAGSGPLHIGICAEYDALPGIGHACGHNIIAAAAVGAGLALGELADELGITVTVLGTPAEEGGGGKIVMLDRGGFDGLHMAMMVHPAPMEASTFPCLAVQHLDVSYRGRSAHASAYPQMGVNAADGFTVAQVALGLLRQHIHATDRIHGIVTHGGDAPNIVPELTTGRWSARSATLAELQELLPKVERCFEAGAIATGSEVTVDKSSPPYSEFRHDVELVRLYEREAEAIGRVFDAPDHVGQLAGSTDMANVSLAMPAIHPMLRLEAGGAVNHQPAFTAACITADADLAVRDGALAMARTVVGITETDDVRDRLLGRAFRAAG
jgi:amidohydrolase